MLQSTRAKDQPVPVPECWLRAGNDLSSANGTESRCYRAWRGRLCSAATEHCKFLPDSTVAQTRCSCKKKLINCCRITLPSHASSDSWIALQRFHITRQVSLFRCQLERAPQLQTIDLTTPSPLRTSEPVHEGPQRLS